MSNHEDYSEESKNLADKKSVYKKSLYIESKSLASKRPKSLDCENYASYFQEKMLSKKDSKNGSKRKPQKWSKIEQESRNDQPKKKRGRPSKEDKKVTKDGNPIIFEKGRVRLNMITHAGIYGSYL